MPDITSQGLSRAIRRVCSSFAIALLCAVVLSTPAGAQVDPGDTSATINEVNGAVCAGAATITVSYTAASAVGVVSAVVDVAEAEDPQNTAESSKAIDPAETVLTDTVDLEVASAIGAIWNVRVTITDANGVTSESRKIVELLADGDCDVPPPSVHVTSATMSGPVCPNDATLSVTLEVWNNTTSPLNLVGGVLDQIGGSVASLEPTIVAAASDPQQFSFELTIPADVLGDKLVLIADLRDEQNYVSSTTGRPIGIERGTGTCGGEPSVVVAIDEVRVCPSVGTISATVSASSTAALELIKITSDLYDGPEHATVPTEGATNVTDTVTLSIPSDAEPGSYELIAQAIDASGYKSVDFHDFTLGADDDCVPGGAGSGTPIPQATIVPTPTPQSATPTPTPAHLEPSDYWDYDDDQVPNAFTAAPFAPASLQAELTPEPTKPIEQPEPGHKPGALAYTGSRTEYFALGGVMLIVAGVTVLYGRRPHHAD